MKISSETAPTEAAIAMKVDDIGTLVGSRTKAEAIDSDPN